MQDEANWNSTCISLSSNDKSRRIQMALRKPTANLQIFSDDHTFPRSGNFQFDDSSGWPASYRCEIEQRAEIYSGFCRNDLLKLFAAIFDFPAKKIHGFLIERGQNLSQNVSIRGVAIRR